MAVSVHFVLRGIHVNHSEFNLIKLEVCYYEVTLTSIEARDITHFDSIRDQSCCATSPSIFRDAPYMAIGVAEGSGGLPHNLQSSRVFHREIVLLDEEYV